MTKPRRITVRGVIYQNNQLLAQQLKPGSDGKERDYWCTPGGGLDPNESLLEGLRREIIEETGIAPKIGKLLFIQQFADESMEFLEFFFYIENTEDYKAIDLSATTHGDLEIATVDFIDPTQHVVLPAFLQAIDIENYIKNNHPVLITTQLSA